MRERGQRIFDKRLKFKSGLQRKFIGEIKRRSGLSWAKLSKSLDVCAHTLKWDLYKEKSTLPITLAKRILSIYPVTTLIDLQKDKVEKVLDDNWGQKKAGLNNLKRINTPKRSADLAEFLGLMLGDGNLNNKGIRITGNALEIRHYTYVKKLIRSLFGLDSTIYISYTNKNTMILNVYSIELVNFLEKNGLVRGNKLKSGASLPEWVFGKEAYILCALRGLLDTDGGIYQKQKGYSRIFVEFQTSSPDIRANLIRLLKKTGFSPSASTGNIRIQNQNEVYKLLAKMGSSNPKNIIRFKEFISHGTIPLKEELAVKIKNYCGSIPFMMQS